MRTRRLGSSDLDVTVVGLGSNNFGGRIDEAAARAVIDAALDAGVTFFDTADVYGNRGGSEEIIGRALAGRRDQVVLATKFGHDLGDGETARGARPTSARPRGIAAPPPDRPDRPLPVPPPRRGHAARGDARGAARARPGGHGARDRLLELHRGDGRGGRGDRRRARADTFVSEQSEYSWLRRSAEEDLLPASERHGVGFIPYFPLASGLLTGKYAKGKPQPEGTRLSGRELDEDDLDAVERLRAFGERALCLAARGRDRRPRRGSRRRLGDRGRDEAGAGARERGCGRLSAGGSSSRSSRARRWLPSSPPPPRSSASIPATAPRPRSAASSSRSGRARRS